jgi:Ca2+-binding RTX toxin-like protein
LHCATASGAEVAPTRSILEDPMNPRRLFSCVCALSALAASACGSVVPKPAVDRVGLATVETIAGNGAHFTLDVVGVPNGKTADLTGDDGHHLFVPLTGNTNILLGEGDFLVVDANGTDGSASFQLPNPDPRRWHPTSYSIWARALATPGGKTKATRCAPDAETGDVYCSVGQRVLVRSADTSSSTDVAEDLLYLNADGDGDGIVERYPLFDSAVGDAFCRRDRDGRSVAQLRFYAMTEAAR